MSGTQPIAAVGFGHRSFMKGLGVNIRTIVFTSSNLWCILRHLPALHNYIYKFLFVCAKFSALH